MLVLKWKERAFIEKVNSRCFCWFPAAILVHQNGTPIWRLHTKLYKGAWNVSANNSETVGHKDKILGHIVYILVFLTFHFLGFFHWTVSNVFFCRFGLKMDIDFAYFGLNSSIVFEGIQECMNVFVISIPNEYERKTNIRIRNGSFKKSFVSVLI